MGVGDSRRGEFTCARVILRRDMIDWSQLKFVFIVIDCFRIKYLRINVSYFRGLFWVSNLFCRVAHQQ